MTLLIPLRPMGFVILLLIGSYALNSIPATAENLSIAYWELDNQTGSTAADSSGNGHTGTS